MRQRSVDSGGLKINVMEDGPEDGTPVLFVHGFPEDWYCWRHQIAACAEAGYRAVALDLRGFGESDRPEGVAHYAITNSFMDLNAVIATLGGKVALVSHDWGGALGWAYTALAQDQVERSVVMNAPHPNAYADLPHHIDQLAASWYMFFFQFEGIAEEVMARNDYELFREWWFGTAKVKIDDDVIQRAVDLVKRPGALTSAVNWYRANVPPESYLGERGPGGLPQITCPTMLLWGLDDPYLTFELGRRAGEYVDGPFALHTLPDTGHWIQQERPDEVNELLLAFLQS